MQIKLSNFIIHFLKGKNDKNYNLNYTNTNSNINHYVICFNKNNYFADI